MNHNELHDKVITDILDKFGNLTIDKIQSELHDTLSSLGLDIDSCRSICEGVMRLVRVELNHRQIASMTVSMRYPGADMARLKDAIALAHKVHTGQQDLAGQPYFEHVTAVIHNTAKLGGSLDALIVAALHDVVEDTHISLSGIKLMFGENIASAVDAISKRSGEPIEEYLDRVKANRLARFVKIADLIHNMDISRFPAPTAGNKERAMRYAKRLAYITA